MCGSCRVERAVRLGGNWDVSVCGLLREVESYLIKDVLQLAAPLPHAHASQQRSPCKLFQDTLHIPHLRALRKQLVQPPHVVLCLCHLALPRADTFWYTRPLRWRRRGRCTGESLLQAARCGSSSSGEGAV